MFSFKARIRPPTSESHDRTKDTPGDDTLFYFYSHLSSMFLVEDRTCTHFLRFTPILGRLPCTRALHWVNAQCWDVLFFYMCYMSHVLHACSMWLRWLWVRFPHWCELMLSFDGLSLSGCQGWNCRPRSWEVLLSVFGEILLYSWPSIRGNRRMLPMCVLT